MEVIFIIRESLYFSFAGRKSSDYGIYNVSFTNGLFEESLTSSKSIVETYVRGNHKPYFIETKKEPKQFQLKFAFLETWNDMLIDEVTRWLNVDFYEPLYFSAFPNRIFYAIPIDGINLIHNGLKQGYLTLTIRCDSPFSYSPEQVTPWIEIKETNDKHFVDNLGHERILPKIWFKKSGDGDLSILNMSDRGSELKLVNLKDQEEIFIDGENEIITTSLNGVYKYDDFNDNYLELVTGKNLLDIKGKGLIKFGYRYLYS